MAKKKKKAASNTLEIQNAAKTMLANIRFASVDSPMQSIVITSSVPNEGKTTTTIELAKAIASSGNSVLLVEADMRRRSAASALGVRASHGAYAVMANQVTLQQAVVSAGVPNFYFLDTEPNIPNPADILSSRAYVRLVDEACDAYDYVLFDTPPVGTFVDAAILSRLVDGVVLVVKIGGAKRDEIVAAYDQLTKAEAHIIGACATFCEGTGSEYYYNKDNQRVDLKRKHVVPRKKVALHRLLQCQLFHVVLIKPYLQEVQSLVGLALMQRFLHEIRLLIRSLNRQHPNKTFQIASLGNALLCRQAFNRRADLILRGLIAVKGSINP